MEIVVSLKFFVPHNAHLHGVMCQNMSHFLINSEEKIMKNNKLLPNFTFI